MKNLIDLRLLACAAFFSSVAICCAVTYTPTTFTDPPVSGGVNSANGVISGGAGNGQVSLRSAIIASNANGTGADTITLGTGTYLLSITSAGGAENNAQTGDLDINGNLAINGNGSANTIISTNYNSTCGDCKVFGVNQEGSFSGLTVSFSGVTIQNGFNNGANFAGSFFETGGGIDFFLTGTGNNYSMTNCVVTNNQVTGSSLSHGAGINVDSANQATPGGASAGSVTFTNVTSTNNTSSTFGGGISLAADKHDVTMTNCTVTGNNATTASGGGVFIQHSFGGTVNINGGTIANNSATVGGGISVTGNQVVNIGGVTFNNNTATGAGAATPLGGGIAIVNLGAAGVTGGTTITNCSFTNNHADGEAAAAGGGVYFNGNYSASVINSVITGNTAESGAGVFHGGSAATPAATLTLTGGYISGNTANTNGGGVGVIDSNNAVIALQNLTVSGNNAKLSGGGLASAGQSVVLTNVTLSNNRADSDNNASGTGGGISRTNRTVTLRNTLVAGNFRGTGSTADDANGTLDAASSFNLIGAATSTGLTNGVNSNQIGSAGTPLDGRLGPLANNGGSTQTHALLAGSPALDAGSNGLVPGGITTDQRGAGFARLLDSADANTTATVDLGALEQHPSIEDVADQAINEDASLGFSFNVGDATVGFDSITATSSNTTLVPNVAANINVTGSGSSRTLTINPVANQFGATTITLTATKTIAGTALSMSDTFVLTVNPIADTPSGTTASTPEDLQTTSGLVLSRNAADGSEVTHFKITSITGGTLFKNNGTTVINNNDLITFAEGNAGLRFTPAANLNSPAGDTFGFDAQAALNGSGAGLSPATTVAITVLAVNDQPSFTASNPPAVSTDGAKTVPGFITNFTAGPTNESSQTALAYPVSNVSNPGLFSAGPSVATNGTLTYTPATGVGGTSTFDVRVQDSGGTANGGIDTSAAQTFTITVNRAPVFTSANSATFTVGTNDSFTVSVSGFPAPASRAAAMPSRLRSPSRKRQRHRHAQRDAGLGHGRRLQPHLHRQQRHQPTRRRHCGRQTQNFTLTVNEAPTITTADNLTVSEGNSVAFPVNADGFPAPTINESGTLPSGVTFGGNTPQRHARQRQCRQLSHHLHRQQRRRQR